MAETMPTGYSLERPDRTEEQAERILDDRRQAYEDLRDSEAENFELRKVIWLALDTLRNDEYAHRVANAIARLDEASTQYRWEPDEEEVPRG